MALHPPRHDDDRRPYRSVPRIATPQRAFWARASHRAVLMGVSLLVIVYSIAVLVQVAWMGDIGVRCIFGTDLKEVVPPDYPWTEERPQVGDTLLAIGTNSIANYTEYIR